MSVMHFQSFQIITNIAANFRGPLTSSPALVVVPTFMVTVEQSLLISVLSISERR